MFDSKNKGATNHPRHPITLLLFLLITKRNNAKVLVYIEKSYCKTIKYAQNDFFDDLLFHHFSLLKNVNVLICETGV